LSKKFAFIDELLSNGNVRLIFCNELLLEIIDVATRPKLKKFFTEDDWKLVLKIINQYADYVNVTSYVSVCRDEKDDFLLALAKDSNANFLITGDNDLLDLQQFEHTAIVTMAEYKMLIS
jgi:putative PIN family toxin of toxin-antitoxin system